MGLAHKEPMRPFSVYLRSFCPYLVFGIYLLGHFDTRHQFGLTAGFLIPVVFSGIVGLTLYQINRQPAPVSRGEMFFQSGAFLLCTLINIILCVLLFYLIC